MPLRPIADFIRRLLIVMTLVVVAAAGVRTAAAQTEAPQTQTEPAQTETDAPEAAREFAPSGSIHAARPRIDEFAAKVAELERRTQAAAEDDGRLVEIRIELEALSHRLLEAGLEFNPRLAEINARLEQLGPPRAEGEPEEPAAVIEERNGLLNEKAEINALLGEAESLSLRVNQLIGEIAQMRRDLFTSTLSKRYDISVALGPQVIEEARVEAAKLTERFSGWFGFTVEHRLRDLLLATFLALVSAAVIFFGGRQVFGSLIYADPAQEAPSYLSRLSVAFWSTLLRSGSLAVFLIATYYFFNYFNLLRDDVSAILVTLFNVIATVYFVNRLAHAAFSPKLPSWRLVPIEGRPARVLFWLVWTTSVVTGIDFVINRINAVQNSPLSLTIAKSLVATIIVGVLVILISLVKPFRDAEGRPRPWRRWFRYTLRVIGATTIVAAGLGYIGLARFISQQVVITGALLATMYIGHLSARAIADLGAFTGTSLGRRLDRRFDFDETAENQLGLVASIVINILILLIGVPLILLQWGFQWGDIYALAYRLASDITVGSIRISIFGILTGILVFIIGFVVTRWFQRWLDGSVMSRGKLDAGVRNSIRTAVGYLGIALAVVIGISAAGIDLSNLALIAGALSLGIGFGLQNIVSNFVSGLILLAERPFKAGDWIVAGPVTGTVKRINVRATEIETFQRQTVILPNSELINSAVGNWTHRNKLGRVDLVVGAASDSDPRHVHRVLDEIVRSHPGILKNPEPMVAFVNFGDSSLDFEVRLYLADITAQLAVTNEIRFTIFERFAEEKISIPFPQRDLHLKTPLTLARGGEANEPDDDRQKTAPVKKERVAAVKPRRRRRRSNADPE